MDGPVVLVDAESDVERGLVTEWLRTHDVHPRDLLPIDAKALTRPLSGLGDDVVITPVRVAWLPRERDGRAGCAVGRHVAGPVTPRQRPPGSLQARIARREPDRARVVVAEPATVGELRGAVRVRARPGASRRSSPGRPGSRWTAPSARLVGDRYKVPKHVVEADRGTAREFRGEVAALAARLELPEPEVARTRRGRPGQARRVHEPDRGRPAHAARCARCTPARGTVEADAAGLGAAARAQPPPRAGVPAQPPLLRRPPRCSPTSSPARFPAQPRDRR